MDQQPVNAANTNTWPGAFAIFKPSLRTVAFNIWIFLAFYVLANAIQFVPDVLDIFSDSTALYVISTIISIVLAVLFGIGLTIVLLRAIDSQKVTFGEAFSESGAFFWKYLGLSVLLGFIALFTLLLLIVPFFIIMPRLVLAPYYMLDQKLGIIESLKASWEQTKGNVGKVYGIVGASIVMFLPVVTIIGIPVGIFLVVAYSAAFPILYKFITSGAVHAPQATIK